MSFESVSLGARAALAGALFLAGCEAGQPAPTPDHRIVVESPSPQIPKVDTPAGVCVELSGDFFSQDQKRENAETCRKAMGGAAVAIVVFEGTGKSEQEMAKVADDVEALVSEASGNLLKVDAEVVLLLRSQKICKSRF